MIKSEDCVVWVNPDNKVVRVTGRKSPVAICASRNRWYNPIGAAFGRWKSATNGKRARQTTEPAMQGYDLGAVLREFIASWREEQRTLTTAIVGKFLEPNTVPFGELLVEYKPKEVHLG